MFQFKLISYNVVVKTKIEISVVFSNDIGWVLSNMYVKCFTTINIYLVYIKTLHFKNKIVFDCKFIYLRLLTRVFLLISFCLLVTCSCPCPQTLILSIRLMHVLICLLNCLIVLMFLLCIVVV